MKRYSIIYMILVGFSFSFVNGDQSFKAVQQVNSIYADYLSGKNYIKFVSYTNVNDTKKQTNLTEVWTEGVKVKLKTSIYTLFADNKTTVFIQPDSKRIVLKSNQNSAPPINQLNYDSLMTQGTIFVEKLSGGDVVLKVIYNQDQIQKLRLKEYHVRYNMKQKLIKETKFLRWENRQWEWHSDHTIARSKTFGNEVLANTSLSKVMSGSRLRHPYEEFELVDLRKKH